MLFRIQTSSGLYSAKNRTELSLKLRELRRAGLIILGIVSIIA